MRILHLDAGREMRGGQWQVLRSLEGLADEGVESTLLARSGAPLFASARQRGWRVAPLSVARVALYARRHDLVHAHDAHSHTLAALALARPLVVSRRVAFEIHSRLKYARATRYIAVSEFVKSVLVRGGVPADRVRVVYDGVPLLDPAHGNTVLAPANIDDPRKGASLALEAARIAGVRLQLSDNLERDLTSAGRFLYITHSEGLGSGALLAMSAGLPVIASKIGGLPEIIEHRKTGLLVENDAAEIAAAIRELQAAPEFARELGAAARRRVAENFTVREMVRRTMEIYRQVLI